MSSTTVVRNSICCLLGLLPAAALAEVPPSAQLLPKTTQQYIAAPSLPQLLDNLKQTKFNDLASSKDQELQRFVGEIRRAIGLQRFGIEWKDVQTAATGELSFALVEPMPNQTTGVMILDAKGKGNELKALVNKMKHKHRTHGYEKEVINGVTIHIYQKDTNNVKEEVCFFLKNERLVAAQNRSVVKDILARWDAKKTDALQNTAAYQKIQKVCQGAIAKSARKKPDLIWFAEPLAIVAALNTDDAKESDAADLTKKLKRIGFDSVKGVGGAIYFGVDKYDIVHHTAVFAPRPHSKALAMFSFEPVKTSAPPAFVAANTGEFATMGLNFTQAFNHFGSYFDTFFPFDDEDTFQQWMKALKVDPHGPEVDVGKQVIGQLSTEVVFLLYGRQNQKRLNGVIAVRTKHEKSLERSVGKLLDDPDYVTAETYANKITIWTIKSSTLADDGKKINKSMAAITVARGHLFLATDSDTLKKVLGEADGKFRGQEDFLEVSSHVNRLGSDPVIRIFSRPDRTIGKLYELYRENKLEDNASPNPIYQILLTTLVKRLDRNKLPAYKKLSPYIAPFGLAVFNRDDGWLIKGFFLKPRVRK